MAILLPFLSARMELLTLGSTLNPIDALKYHLKLKIFAVLLKRFYPQDFTKIELQALRIQLECLEIDVHSL